MEKEFGISRLEELYKYITENANDLIAVFNRKIRFEFVNENVHKKVLGYTKEDLLNKQLGMFIHPEDIKKVLDIIRDQSKEGEGKAELRFKKKDGNYIWLEVRGGLFRNHEGKLEGITISRDITERKLADRMLKESELRFRHLFEDSPNGIILLDLSGKILEVNSWFLKTFKYEKEELIGKNFQKIERFDPINIAIFQTKFKQMIQNGFIDPFEIKIFVEKGEIRWIIMQASFIEIEGNKLIQVIMQDISKTKQAEQELKEFEEKYGLISENANDLIIILNKDSTIEYVNKGPLLKMLGYKPEEVIGEKTMKFMHPNDLGVEGFQTVEYLKMGLRKIELKINHKKNYYVPVESSISLFIDKNNEVKQLIIIRDITERKEAEKKLKESEKKYRRAYDLASFYKDLFAHDMSNILQSILSTAELYTFFKDEKTRIDKLGEFSEAIRKHTIRGANLITNIRKLSKVEETGIETQPINVQEYLNKAVENIYNTFQRKSINIKIDGLQENLIVYGDELILDVFENIMNNSVKYNNKDEVNINIKISDYQESNINYIKMEFIDNGIGIDDEKKRFIFSRIVHKDKSRSGMGIGLSLVKKIMDGYNGKVWIEDRVKGNYSQGSNFILLFQKA